MDAKRKIFSYNFLNIFNLTKLTHHYNLMYFYGLKLTLSELCFNGWLYFFITSITMHWSTCGLSLETDLEYSTFILVLLPLLFEYLCNTSLRWKLIKALGYCMLTRVLELLLMYFIAIYTLHMYLTLRIRYVQRFRPKIRTKRQNH